MKRLYYLTDNLESTDKISHDLHDHGITDWNFHVVSKDEKGLYKCHLHSANAIQKTDWIHRGEQGLLKGLAAGALVFWLVSMIPIHGRLPEFGFLLALFLIGVFAGIFHGVLLGYQNENIKLKPFHEQIENGQYLIMVDVPRAQMSRVESLMAQNHPEAILCDEGSTWIWPFVREKRLGV